jgi:hypothetical protein
MALNPSVGIGQQEELKAEIYTWAARLGRQEGEIFIKKIN